MDFEVNNEWRKELPGTENYESFFFVISEF
jgi:hypothetical protein